MLHTIPEAINLLQSPVSIDVEDYLRGAAGNVLALEAALDKPLDLYLLLLHTKAAYYTCNHLPRRRSSVSVSDHFLLQGNNQTRLHVHLVKNSPLGQLVYPTDKKYRYFHPATDLFNRLETDAEIISYNQARARATLVDDELDRAYVLLAPLAPPEREDVLLGVNDLTALKLNANPAISAVMQEYREYWGADSDIYTCTLQRKLEKKYGTWRELKLRALLAA